MSLGRYFVSGNIVETRTVKVDLRPFKSVGFLNQAAYILYF